MVTIDSNATADVTSNSVTSITSTNLTVGSGSNRALLAQLSWGVASGALPSAVSVTWDSGGTNQACTVIKSDTETAAANPIQADIWGLVAPVSGAKTLKAAWTTSADVVINATSWTLVDQTGGVTSFPNANSSKSTSLSNPTLTITSAVGNATMVNGSSLGTLSAPTQTQTYLDNSPANVSGAGSRAAGAASVTHSWTGSGTPGNVAVGCDIKASVAAATDTLEYLHKDWDRSNYTPYWRTE